MLLETNAFPRGLTDFHIPLHSILESYFSETSRICGCAVLCAQDIVLAGCQTTDTMLFRPIPEP